MTLVVSMGLASILTGVSCPGQTVSRTTASPKLERMPESLEIRFRLSAAPPHPHAWLRQLRSGHNECFVDTND